MWPAYNTRSSSLKASIAVWASLWVVVGACSGGSTLTDYAEEVEALVTTMNERIDGLEVLLVGSPDLEDVQMYAAERVAARVGFVEGVTALQPPDEAADLHVAAIGVMGRLADAEATLADRVAALTELPDEDIWETPEGQAARVADQAAIDLCLAAQSDLNETEAREMFADVPWVPPQMKEVVVVAFGCMADER